MLFEAVVVFPPLGLIVVFLNTDKERKSIVRMQMVAGGVSDPHAVRPGKVRYEFNRPSQGTQGGDWNKCYSSK